MSNTTPTPTTNPKRDRDSSGRFVKSTSQPQPRQIPNKPVEMRPLEEVVKEVQQTSKLALMAEARNGTPPDKPMAIPIVTTTAGAITEARQLPPQQVKGNFEPHIQIQHFQEHSRRLKENDRRLRSFFFLTVFIGLALEGLWLLFKHH